METQLVLAVLEAFLMQYYLVMLLQQFLVVLVCSATVLSSGDGDSVGSGCTGGFADAVFFVPDTAAVPGRPSPRSISLSSFLFLFSITFSSYSPG